MKDLGVNERFTLEIPKVKEGETVYYVEHVNKSGDPLSDPIAVTVNCKLPKATDMSAGTNNKLNSIVGVLCWPKGTEKKKYLYSSGSPKDAYVKAAQKYLGGEVGEIRKGRRVAFTDCSYFAATVIRMSGADPKFRALRFDYAKKNADWIVVSEGKRVDASKLIAGDVIQYKKKGGGKHVIIYLGNKLYAQASRNDQFPIIFTQKRPGKEMYNASKVNINSLQVIRNKKIASGQIQ
jgi:cell wall-associated NlpC family hydrolase